MNPDSLTDWLNKFSKRCGIPNVHPHKFRHTMASLLYFGGLDSITISKRLGHAKVSTTTDIYSHIIQQADEQAADKIAETIFRAGKKKSDKKRSGSNSKQMGEFDRFFEVVRQMCATGRITFTR